MDAEMADLSAVGPDPAGLAIGANPARKAGPSNTKRRRMNNQEIPGTANMSYISLCFRPSSNEVAKICAFSKSVCRPCPVPNVALDDFYEQMKLGVESFSSWWKKKFPEGTYEDDIQKAFEMYRLSVTQADLVHLMGKHADHVPFTLSADLKAKRKELIDDFYTTQAIAMHDLAEQEVAEAQAALINFSTEYLFWHTMSRARPAYVLIGAGAASSGARDTPDELAFQISRSVYLEKARLGFAEFEAWFKDHFKAAALLSMSNKAIKSLFEMFSFEIAEEEAKTIDEKVSMHAQKIKAEQRWRAAIGVPRNFDDRTKELLSIVKDAKWKASVANIDKRVECYHSAIDEKIDLYNRLIKVLAKQKEQTEDLTHGLMPDNITEDFKEISVAKDMQPLEAMVVFEEAKKSWAVVDALEDSWTDEAIKNLDIARENLQEHLNSITRRQYLYSTIKISLNPWLEHGFPSEVFEQFASK